MLLLLDVGAWRRSLVITGPIGGSSAWLARIDSGLSQLIAPAAAGSLAAARGWPRSPGCCRHQPRPWSEAAGGLRGGGDGGHGPPCEGPQAGRCRWPAAHGTRLHERPREALAVAAIRYTDLQC